LFATDTAADGVKIKAGVLCRFHSNAQVLAKKGWDLDSTFFYIEDDCSTRWQFLRG